MQKSEIRKEVGERFKGYESTYFERVSSEIQKQVLKYIMGSDVKTVLCYISTKDEVQTLGIMMEILDSNKRLFVPKVIGSQMIAVEITDMHYLEPGYCGILEPQQNISFEGKIDVCITPGVAFTKTGKRIGKGKGYYDDFFSHFRVKNKIGICYDFQIFDDFEIETHDVDMDLVITNS